MPKTPFAEYSRELEDQREAWQRKPALRSLYHHWYARIVRELSPHRPVVEIGSGCGNFKAFFPEVVATDAMATGEWIDRVIDARDLPFSPGEVGNFVLIDCLHHLPRPLRFLRAAARALRPGGRVVLLEPAATPWARWIWRTFHHERLDFQQDLLAEDDLPEPENEGFTFSNIAIASLLFERNPQAAMERSGGLTLKRIRYSDCLVYPATGGFSYHCFVPGALVRPLLAIERTVMMPLASWLTGLRMLVVLEKPPADEIGPTG